MTLTRARRTSVTAIALLAASALALTGCTSNNNGGDVSVNSVDAGVSASIDEAVNSALALSHSNEAIVGVWSASGEYVRGYGDGVNANSRFRAAQATQPVMCALALDLVAKGELKLDRKLSKDLSRQVGLDNMTYGELCDGTSGLADFKTTTVTDIFANNPERPWSDRELFAQALAHSHDIKPGTTLQPSDTNALLLARALRQTTSTPVYKALQERVFAPAGMSQSAYPADPSTALTLPSDSMTGYTYKMAGGAPVCTAPGENEGETVPVEPTATPEVSLGMLGGAGATVTTVTDLKKFYERYVDGQYDAKNKGIVTTLATPKNAEPAAPAEGEEAPAAPVDGWTFGLEKQGPLYGMSGAITGTLTAAYHDPAGKFTVVVALNNSTSGAAFARALAFEIASLSGVETGWSADDQKAALAERAVCQ